MQLGALPGPERPLRGQEGRNGPACGYASFSAVFSSSPVTTQAGIIGLPGTLGSEYEMAGKCPRTTDRHTQSGEWPAAAITVAVPR